MVAADPRSLQSSHRDHVLTVILTSQAGGQEELTSLSVRLCYWNQSGVSGRHPALTPRQPESAVDDKRSQAWSRRAAVEAICFIFSPVARGEPRLPDSEVRMCWQIQ
jgi:hypothetical protein